MTDRYVAAVNKNLSALHHVSASIYLTQDIRTETDAYVKNGAVQKIAVFFSLDDDGRSLQIEREYYYDDRRLQFVHEEARAYDEQAKDYVKTEENWFYFDKGKMVTWLSGDKKETKVRDKEYFLQEEDVLVIARDLLTGLGPRLAWKKNDPIPLASFLPGRVFRYSCVAGEDGKFEPDGRIQASLFDGFGFINPRVGAWRLDGEKLIVSGTNVTDDAYQGFIFEEKDGSVIAYNPTGGCGMTIAKDIHTIEQYEDAHVYFFPSAKEEESEE